LAREDSLGDQGVHVGRALGCAVKHEVQRRHGVDVQALEQAVAQKPAAWLSAACVSTGSPMSRLKNTLACA
jgi:hypothetical protein